MAAKSSGGSGMSILTILFVILKLTGVIAWKWIWVFAPLWIGSALFAVFGILGLLGIGAFALFNRK